jgi:uncharacterized membrane protein
MPRSTHNRERRPVPRHLPQSARARLLVALIATGLAAYFAQPLRPALRLLVALNAGLWVLIGMVSVILLTADAVRTRARAAAEDEGRALVHVVVLVATMLSLVAAIAALREHGVSRSVIDAWLPLSLATVVGAWILNHSSWALHYAHLYYRDDRVVGGLEFPGGQAPDDMDFAYFAFTIGMCAQTSDVLVTGRVLRRSTLFHAVQSFAFNTTVIALMLNVIYGLLSG